MPNPEDKKLSNITETNTSLEDTLLEELDDLLAISTQKIMSLKSRALRASLAYLLGRVHNKVVKEIENKSREKEKSRSLKP